MKTFLKIQFLLVWVFCAVTASAQETKTYTFDGVVLSSCKEHQTDVYSHLKDVEGAVVMFIVPSDTVFTTTDSHGRFLFRKITHRQGLLRVEHLKYEPWEKAVSVDTLQALGVHVVIEEKREKIDAAVVKEKVPVFEMIGDTLKYNVASTQRISADDMLGDVLERLPGISNENGLLTVNGETVAKVYIDGKLVFGDSVSDPLQYLAGSEIISLKVYDQATVRERLGYDPKGSKKERVINAVTKSKINSALIAQAVAGYGRNMEATGTEMDNRYCLGATANWFSEALLLSANVYLNNIGRTNVYRAVTDISSVPSSYGRVGYAGLKFSRKWGDYETGQKLEGSYSYGNDKGISERRVTRVYSPDQDWTSRTYSNDSRTLSRSDAHNVVLSYSSYKPIIPSVILTLSAADNSTVTQSRMVDVINGEADGYGQYAENKGTDYKISLDIQEHIFLTKKRYAGLDLIGLVDGGYSSGGGIQRDTSISTSSVSAYVTEPLGRNLKGYLAIKSGYPVLNETARLVADYSFKHDYSTLAKLRYDDTFAEARLDSLTSDLHTYNYDSHLLYLGLSAVKIVKGFSYTAGLGLDYAMQKRDNMLPFEVTDRKTYLSFRPNFNLVYMKGHRVHMNAAFMAIPVLPSSEQVSRYFNDTDPLFITSGNPDLKKAMQYKLQYSGSFMVGSGHSLKAEMVLSMTRDNIVSKSMYYASDEMVRDYLIPAGTTLNSYANVNGNLGARLGLGWSTSIKPLKVNLQTSLTYAYSKDPTYVQSRLNTAHAHTPRFHLVLKSNFSKKYVVDLTSNTYWSDVRNSSYDDVKYLTQNVSLNSRNRIAPWLFVNAQYAYSLRHPVLNAGSKIQDHMLNAIVGVPVPKTKFEISASCYDILNRTTSFKTSVLRNYTQTSFTPDLGRIWLVSLVYRFNSTQKPGASDIMMGHGYNSRDLGRRYEERGRIVELQAL